MKKKELYCPYCNSKLYIPPPLKKGEAPKSEYFFKRRQQVTSLYKHFPSQGDIGYRYRCTDCGSWLICECRKDFYMKYLPHYFDKINQRNDRIFFIPTLCAICRYNNEAEKKSWERFKRFIEYIAQNDKGFFDYCYGHPVSGYEKDMDVRSTAHELPEEAGRIGNSLVFTLDPSDLPPKEDDPNLERMKDEAEKAKKRQQEARKKINDYLYRNKSI
jgi:hypothetical protein